MPNKSRFFGFGSGGIPPHPVTVKDTLIGIVLPGLFMVGSRLLMATLAFFLILAIGRQAGGVIAGTVALYLYVAILTKQIRGEKSGALLFSLVIAAVLMFVETLGYWPAAVVDWQWIDLQMYWSAAGGEFQPATPIVMFVRLFAILVVPMVVWSPARFVDWALGIEIVWPIARETRFSSGDPGSIPVPSDMAIRAGKRDEQPPAQARPIVVQAPSPNIQGE